MPLLTFEGVQVDVPAMSGVQLSFSATGELTIRCDNFTGDVVLSALKAEPATLVSSSSSSASSSRPAAHRSSSSSSKRKSSVDSNDLSDDSYSGSSALDRLQKRRRLDAIQHAKKSKLSTQYSKRGFKMDTSAQSPPSRRLPPPPPPAAAKAKARVASAAPPSRTTNILQFDEQLRAVDLTDCVEYFQTLTARERSTSIQEESEDVCFICKDGGELIECDWTEGHGCNSHRCPKVYHEACLGYRVPEDFAWNCPRHRCELCGVLATFSCRFCVSSYCSEHVPREIKKLGRGSRDIPDSMYVFCRRCERNSQEALETGKLSGQIYALMLRPSRPKQ